MKQIYFLLAILLLAHSYVNAKEDAENATTGIPGGGGGFPHFTPTGGSNSAGGVVHSFRVVARTNAKYNGSFFAPVDSTSYSYSNGRGGNINADEPAVDESILFDDSYTYIYNPSISQYDNRLYRKQTFDAQNDITSLTYSSWHASTAAWKDSARYLYSYVPGTNKMDGSVLQISQGGTMWVQHDLSSLTYSGNNVVAVNSSSYNATFTYDANNNITSIEDKIFDHASGTLNNNQHKIYTYNAGNEVTSYTLQQWSGTAWNNTKYWEYTYSNGQVATSLEYNWNGSNWKLAAKHILAYANGTDKLSETVQLWDESNGVFVNYSNEVWEYNMQGLVGNITLSTWNKANGNWEYQADNRQIRFYYEYYSPTTVHNMAATDTDLDVYPIPASSILHVNLKAEGAKPFNIAIYDMAGQLVLSRAEQSAGYLQEINISSLPPSDYILKATNKDMQLVRKIEVSR